MQSIPVYTFLHPQKSLESHKKSQIRVWIGEKKDKNILVEGDKVNKGTISSFFPLEKTRAQMANDNFRKPGKTFLI